MESTTTETVTTTASAESSDSTPAEAPSTAALPPLRVEYRPIDSLIPYPRNPRTHTPEQVAQIAGSIREYGWTNPLLVDGERGVIAGHGRLEAARLLGMTTVPVIELGHLTPTQRKAYVTADNRLAELAGWDTELLKLELEELQALDFDLDLVGFTADDLVELQAAADVDVIEDEPPGLPETATTRRGDIWVLGNHRLMCGDSASAEDVDRLLAGARIHLANTDPPYNVKVEPRSNNAIAAGLSSFTGTTHHQGLDLARHPSKAKATHDRLRPKDRPLANDFVSDEAFAQMLLAWFGNLARVLEPGRSFYIWGGYSNFGNYPPALKASGLYFSQAIIWDKQHPVLTRKDFMGAFEVCYYGWREGAGHSFFGPNNVRDLWAVKKVNPQSMVHLTEKPVELAARALTYSSRPGENVIDLFGGSGSTLIAAEQLGRRAYLMELDPLYADVIVQRWEKFTAKKAERIAASDTAPVEPEAVRSAS